MECPICFEIIENSCVGPCMHHFCYKCLMKWISFGGINCPSCKQIIYELKFDKEFDLINNPNNMCNQNEEYSNKIYIDFRSGKPPGIVIQNLVGLGVKVIKLNNTGACYKSGLKVGDIILKLNNIPCYNNSDSIEIIKSCHNKNIILVCEILIKNK